MREWILTVGLLLYISICQGQDLYIDSGVDTSDKKVATAIDFYRQYLGEIRYDALPDFKKYWSAKDLQKNKNPDPVFFAITNFPTYLMAESKTLIYAKAFPDYVQLKTLFATADSLKAISVTCITNHYIGFDNQAQPYFISPMDMVSQNWKQVEHRNVTFIYPPQHRFNTARADSLLTSIKKLEKDWALEPISFRYYLTDSKDELRQLRGFDYVIGMGNRETPVGRSDDQDNIIYASGLGENYFHEVVHLYLNRRFPNSPLREGLATFYGGSFGMDLGWHIQYLNEYIQKHPERDLNKFYDFHYLDHYTNPTYTIEGLLCLLAYRKDGLAGLKRIMAYTSLEDIFRKEFGVEPGQWDAFIRKELAGARDRQAALPPESFSGFPRSPKMPL